MRIISLLPSATEIICALGLSESLVGISHECDYPAAISNRAKLTSSILQAGLDPAAVDAAVTVAAKQGQPIYSVDPHVMEALSPDLIITQGVCDVCAVGEATVRQSVECVLQPAGSVDVLSLTGVTFEGVLRDIGRVGEVTGHRSEARELVLKMQARWSAVGALPALARTPRVLMLEWPDPAWTAGHWVPEMVSLAGGVDVFGSAGGQSARTSWSDIANADPEIIISIACGHGVDKNLEFARGLRERPELKSVDALRAGRVFAADANSYFSRPAPRMVRGAELIAFALGRDGATEPSALELVRAW